MVLALNQVSRKYDVHRTFPYTRTNTVFFPNPTSAIAPFSLLAVFEEDCKLGSKLLQGHKTGATRTVMHNVYCQYN